MNPIIQLPVSELKTALAGLNKVIHSKSYRPILGCVRLAPDSKGHLTLQGTDSENFLTYRFNEPQKESFDPLHVPFEALSRQSKKMGVKDQLLIGRTEQGQIHWSYELAGNRIELPVETIPDEDWPVPPPNPSASAPLEEEFKLALGQAFQCASTDSTRYILNGAFLDVSQPQAHYLIGTDGRHLYAANSWTLDLSVSVIIPTRRFLNWPGFLEDGPWALGVALNPEKNGGWIQLRSPHWTFDSKLIEGNFPDWRNVVPIPGRSKSLIQLDASAMDLMREVLPKMPGQTSCNQTVHLVVQAGSFLLRGHERRADPWTTIPVPGVQVSGPDQEVSINRSYVLKALRFGLNEIEIHDAESAVIFQARGKKLIVMPLRIDTPPTPPVEAAESNVPSLDQSQPQTENNQRNNPMAVTTSTTPERAIPRLPNNNGDTNNNGHADAPEDPSALQAVVQQIDKVKSGLREVLSDLNDALSLLKAAEKERRTTSKEIEAVRSKLREIQSVAI